MALFQKGQSGNPGGRPRTATGLRQHLEEQYGTDARKLVARLEHLSVSRNQRVALEATRLLLSYHAGTPQQSFDVTGQIEHAAALQVVPADALCRLTPAQLDVLAALNGTDIIVNAEDAETPEPA